MSYAAPMPRPTMSPHRTAIATSAVVTLVAVASAPLASEAQSFTPAPDVFDGVYFPALAFDDLDGDGDVDLVLAGADGEGVRTTILYLGDGAGGFAKAPRQPFTGMMYADVATIDVDVDGDLDVLLTGSVAQREWRTELYYNDGTGDFVPVGSAFEDVSEGAIAVADVDDDGDADVLLAGSAVAVGGVGTQLYLNDGRGAFSAVAHNEFVRPSQATAAFADLDGDGDPDLIIGGVSWPVAAERYRNEGHGRFARVEPLPYEGTSWSAMALGDLDGDGDPDAVFSGERGTSGVITEVYRNIGRAGFTPVDNPLPDLFLGGVALGDVDSDGDLDVALTGRRANSATGGTSVSEVFLNDGLGYFTAVEVPDLPQLHLSTIALEDVNGDGSPDLFVAGYGSDDAPVARLLLNDAVSAVGDREPDRAPRLWPNPIGADGRLYFSTTDGPLTRVDVLDARGRHVLSADGTGGAVDVSALPSGVYALRVGGSAAGWFVR